jgi:hypothetical protein
MHMVGCNVDGVKPFGINEKLETTAVRLRHLQAGSACLIKTNVEWHKYEYINTTASVFRKEFGSARVELGTLSEKVETSHYNPGVTVSVALGPWVHRVVETDKDPTGCGRCTYITYAGEENKRTTVITAYRVGDQY